MDLTRRDFLKASSSGALAGTALGTLTAVGASLAPAVAQAQQLRIEHAKATPSVCPYCSVGCATLVHTIEGKIVNIEGDPRSPHNEGTLCPKGAAIYQLHVNPNRPTIFSLGGATLDCEWNHAQQKLMRGLGVVAIENQARI